MSAEKRVRILTTFIALVVGIGVLRADNALWIKVDYYRGEKEMKNFLEWGIPTAECLVQCRDISIPIIASGGIRNGLEIAKAIAMGASLAGMALPLLKPAMESSNAVKEKLEKIIRELKTAMLLVGARNIDDLKKAKLAQVQ